MIKKLLLVEEKLNNSTKDTEYLIYQHNEVIKNYKYTEC